MFSFSEIKTVLKNYNPSKVESPDPAFVPAAVLILLFEAENGLEVVLTKRTTTLKTHKGQIAFPGGAVDESDKSIAETALRECWEEIGVKPETIEIIGTLDEIITVTDFIVTPVIGFSTQTPVYQPNPHEIEKIFTVPLSFLFDSSKVRIEEWVRKEIQRKIYFWNFDGEMIWGLTGEIIKEFGCIVSGKQLFESVPVSESSQVEFLSKIITT